MTKKLLIVANTPSENTRAMAEAVLRGTKHPDLDIHTRLLAPSTCQAQDLIEADAIIIGTTENLGYMSGLIKDVFDRCYYLCLEHTQAKPFAFYVRAGLDGTGTRRAIESISSGLKWRLIQAPLICKGDFKQDFIEQCEQLGLSVAASLDAGII